MALVNTITELKESIDNYFNTIDRDQLIFLVNTIKNCSGTVFLTGIGKSGLIASVFAHMLMSIGTCSEFLDPVNALHGDVGKLRSSSIVIMFSKSGSNVELIELCENLKQRNVKTYLITCVKQSSLHAITNYTVFIPLDFETGSFSLAPLTSSILQLITSNIIVSELMKEISKRGLFIKSSWRINWEEINHACQKCGPKSSDVHKGRKIIRYITANYRWYGRMYTNNISCFRRYIYRRRSPKSFRKIWFRSIAQKYECVND